MKLIFENWRRYLNEEKNLLSQTTVRLISMLINMKKFNGIDDFLKRVEMIRTGDLGGMQFIIKIDGSCICF